MSNHRFGAILITSMGLGLMGCDRQNASGPATQSTPTASASEPATVSSDPTTARNLKKLRDSAYAIVADPSNWKENSRELADFVAAADGLHWDDKTEVREFLANAKSMFAFSTTWVEHLDNSEIERLKEKTTSLTAEMNASVSAVPSASITSGAGQTKGVVDKAKDTITNGAPQLKRQAAEDMGTLYGKLLDAWGRIDKLTSGQLPAS